jgi:hypothetical protein
MLEDRPSAGAAVEGLVADRPYRCWRAVLRWRRPISYRTFRGCVGQWVGCGGDTGWRAVEPTSGCAKGCVVASWGALDGAISVVEPNAFKPTRDMHDLG